MKDTDKIELLAPGGSYESIAVAIRAGADAIYFGVDKLNMRANATNKLSLKDIKKIARMCRWCGVKSYLTLNTLIYNKDLVHVRKICKIASEAGISAIIATDIAVILEARSMGIPVHISVQANISNIEAVRYYSKFADVVVLARELTLEQIKEINDFIKKEQIRGPSDKLLRTEVFIHGALCIAVSGTCGMSLAQYNTSAQRGECYQPCRRTYKVTDTQTGFEYVIDNKYVMSPKDICMIKHLDKILESGVSILKVEGRGRNAQYVNSVISAYRTALHAIRNGRYSEELAEKLIKKLEEVFNRGFWMGGYYLGKNYEQWNEKGISKAGIKRVLIGKIDHYYKNISVAVIRLIGYDMEKNSTLVIEGPTTGSLQVKVDEIRVDNIPVEKASADSLVSFIVPRKVRKNDRVFLFDNKS